MKKRWLLYAALILMLVPQVSATMAKPAINARSSILIDATNGKLLYTKNAWAIMAPASTTKIMTAVLTLEKLDLDRVVTIRPTAASREGTSMGLKNQERRTVRELLYGLMLESGNDAATALAETISGTEEKFAVLMTQKAKNIGMKNTAFKNASGLPEIGHYTTAYDMAILTRYAFNVPGFSRVVGTKIKEIPGAKPGGSQRLRNHNKLLWRYPYATGVKTGYTVNAGGCLVSSAVHKGKALITVVLKTPTIYDDTIKLFDYGFRR